MGLVQSDVEQIVPVVLARAGYLRRCIEGETDGEFNITLCRILDPQSQRW